jgi:hypothetical protein|uniref:hypothetical protein n=1 Tax=Prevotella sp. TaxID=59823 RepID=UPI003FF0BDCC
MKVITNTIIPPKGYKAITILNMVFVRKGCTMSKKDLNHECIHWEQEKELLIVGFYLLYVLEFLFRLIKKRCWREAYRSISFERECYENEMDMNYTRRRKHFQWMRYFKV